MPRKQSPSSSDPNTVVAPKSSASAKRPAAPNLTISTRLSGSAHSSPNLGSKSHSAKTEERLGAETIDKMMEALTSSDTSLAAFGLPEEQNPVRLLAERVRQARNEKGLTQQQLATLIGVHISSIAHLETLKDDGALPGHSRSIALERTLGLKDGEIWALVEQARAVMRWRRSVYQQQFQNLEMLRQGVSPQKAEQNFSIQLPLPSDSAEADAEIGQALEIVQSVLKLMQNSEQRARLLDFVHTELSQSQEPNSKN